MDEEVVRLKLLKLQRLEEAEKLREGLPHLHRHKLYSWQRQFFESRNKLLVLCASNQSGKSEIQIKKTIHWATEPKLWPTLWPGLQKGEKPNTFFYLYPTRDLATIEFFEKWNQFLPAGEYKDHPQYGYEVEMDNKKIFAIHFKTGCSIYFKTYAMDQEKLQGSTVFYVATDEELPADLFDELQFRVAAVEGYMSFSFTATQGQQFWREVVEKRTRLPEAEVINVSMFDCLEYEDGTPGKYTVERINQIIARCATNVEVQRRVYGRFAVSEGLKYASFSRDKSVVAPYAIPKDWIRYAGIDVGGGGAGHPSAITFIAVKPDFSKGVVYKHWRGDGILTTAQDTLQKFLEMREGEVISQANYDWACRDMTTIAARAGVGLRRAEKGHELGEGTLNSLFRNKMLDIFSTFTPLIEEFENLLESTPKTKAKDDSIDSCRYAGVSIPWDWSNVTLLHELPEKKKLWTMEDERRSGIKLLSDPHDTLDEFEQFNQLLEF